MRCSLAGSFPFAPSLTAPVVADLIGDPTHSRQGIAALYEFQKEHPEVNPRVKAW